jgi:outer membrane protein assembly factor BamD
MRRIHWLFIVILALAFQSCGEYQKAYKSKDATVKYQKAMQLYAKKDYAKSVVLLEQLKDIYRRTDSLEVTYYHIAMCYFKLEDYTYASMFFKDYTDNFSKTPRTLECAYLGLYCDYMGIGPLDLDQSDTKNVIDAMQTFTNYYPDSQYTQKCNEHIDDMRHRLQQKEYERVMQYYNMGEYKSVVTAARNSIKMYPDIQQREELEFLTVKSQYLYAKNSIEAKRLERFQEVLVNFEDYKYNNAKNSEHYAEALSMFEDSKVQIKKLKENL